MPLGSGWSESPLYSFAGNDGANPWNGVILDNAGNLYGTTLFGGLYGYGTVFQLTYSAGSGWTEKVLYSFQGGDDGSYPTAGLIFDQSGSLYGATGYNSGTVFELTPSNPPGSWTLNTLYTFTGPYGGSCGPWGSLVMDGAGNLYGTTHCDGADNAGSVFKLTPSGNSWTYTSLHDFTGGNDGGDPYCSVVFDGSGNLYGTAYLGGSQGAGVVWEIMP